MPGKTNTEAIRDLEQTAAALTERVDNLRRDTDDLEAEHAKTVDTLTRAVTQLAVLEERFANLKKALEESDRKRWLVLVAVIGSFLALAANIALAFFRK